ncbi:hypothetical protein TI05_02400 [Achromatium sp. WMS3]|nr:hypothetical protein TI05_02400 [Achromatium sp. WMS3]
MRKLFNFLLSIIILAGAFALFKYLKSTKPLPPKAKITERVWQVNVETIKPQELAPGLILYGKVETPSFFKAAAPIPSRVSQVLVRDGQRVTKRQRLITLDPQDFTPPLQQAQATVAELEAQIMSETIRNRSDKEALEQEKRLLALAKTNFNRSHTLRRKRLTSAANVDQAEEVVVRQDLAITARQRTIKDYPARIAVLKAKLHNAKAHLSEAVLNEQRSRIHAPYASVISKVSVTAGDQVNANTVLLTLYAPESLEIRAKIPATLQWEIQQALAMGLNLTGFDETNKLKLRLVRLAGVAATTGIDALFRIETGLDNLRPGQLVRFTLRRPTQSNVIPVPYSALYGGKVIYTLREGRLHQHLVTILGRVANIKLQNRLLVQAKGIVAKDQLVITNLPNAIHGLRVEAVEQQ